MKEPNQMTEHERYFGAARYEHTDSLESWKSAYTRVIQQMDKLSPNWRKRSVYVGDALHQELDELLLPLVKQAKRDKAILDARNRVAELQNDLAKANEVLNKAIQYE